MTSRFDAHPCPSCRSSRSALVMPDDEGTFAHRCFDCGYRWTSDARTEVAAKEEITVACPSCKASMALRVEGDRMLLYSCGACGSSYSVAR